MRHYSFDSGAWDLGTYEQMLWTTIHSGKLFWAAPDPINPTGFFFGTHFSPILFIILPIYFLHQATETLLIMQSFVLALGALPLYWLARDELKSKIAGLIIAVAYLFYAPLHGVNWFDFHTQAFIPVFFNLAFYYFTKKKWIQYLICVFLVLSVNEAMPLMIIAMGVYGLWKKKKSIIEYLSKKKTAFNDKTALISLTTILLGIIWFIVARKIISSINPSLPFTMWSEFGTDLPSIIINMISDPLHTLEVTFSQYAVDKFFYIIELFLPLLFLSFLDPASLIIALPWIGMSFLSNITPYITPVGYQYPAHILSIIFVSAVYGIKRLRTIRERINVSPRFHWIKSIKNNNNQLQHIALILIMICSVSTYVGLSPLGMNFKLGVNGRPIGSLYNDVLQDVIAIIPNTASITTQDNIFPIFSRRMNAYPYPNKTLVDNTLVDYILVDTRNMWYHVNVPFPHIETDIPYFDELISEVTRDRTFGLLVAFDGIYLFKKDYRGEVFTPVLHEGLTATFYNRTGKVGETQVLNIAWDWSRFSPFPGHIHSSEYYRIKFHGSINITKEGEYTFRLDSEENAILKIDNEQKIESPKHPTIWKGNLKVGLHKIEVVYERKEKEGIILLYWRQPDKNYDEIIPSQYFIISSDE
jgi:uncharacterized membrane protein